MAEFAIEGDVIRCLEGDRGGMAPGRLVRGGEGVVIEDGPSIEGLGLAGDTAPTREALVERMTEAGHVVHAR